MAAEALQLNLAVLYPHGIARLGYRRWPGQGAPIADAEARAVPGARHHITLQRPFIQRPTRVRTRGADRSVLLATTDQRHRHTRHQYAIQLVLHDTLNRQHRLIILSSSLPGCMVDVRAFAKDHIAAQIPGEENSPHADKSKHSSGNRFACANLEA